MENHKLKKIIKKLKNRFHQHKNSILIHNTDINKIVVSSKVSFAKKDFKYFFGYKHAKEIRPLCILLPKINTK